MFDVTIVVAGVESVPGSPAAQYVGTSIFRLDLDSTTPTDVEEFIRHVRAYKGIAHGEELAATKVIDPS